MGQFVGPRVLLGTQNPQTTPALTPLVGVNTPSAGAEQTTVNSERASRAQSFGLFVCLLTFLFKFTVKFSFKQGAANAKLFIINQLK